MRMRIDAIRNMTDSELAGQQWLDAGCGAGDLSAILLSQKASVECADASPEMLSNAEKSLEGFAPRVQFCCIETIESLPYQDSSFEGLLCSSVVEYVQQPEQCLSEFKRVLKPGGQLLLSVPNRNSLLRKAHKVAYAITKLAGRPRPAYMAHSHNDYTVHSISRQLESVGFHVEKFELIGMYKLSGVSFLRRLLQPVIFVSARRS